MSERNKIVPGPVRNQGVASDGRPDTAKVTVTFPTSTRFGAPSRPVDAPAAVLRARAAASGVRVLPAPPVDLLASAMVVDAWMALLGARSLDDVRLYGPDAARVLAAALARAAGHPSGVVDAPLEECASSPELLRLAEQHRAWACELCPDAPGQVLLRAGSDLCAAGPGSRFESYGALLQLLASEPW